MYDTIHMSMIHKKIMGKLHLSFACLSISKEFKHTYETDRSQYKEKCVDTFKLELD